MIRIGGPGKSRGSCAPRFPISSLIVTILFLLCDTSVTSAFFAFFFLFPFLIRFPAGRNLLSLISLFLQDNPGFEMVAIS